MMEANNKIKARVEWLTNGALVRKTSSDTCGAIVVK